MERQLDEFSSNPIIKSEEEDDFSNDIGSESQSCLICFETVVNGGGEEGEGDGSWWWWKQFQRPGEPPSLSRNVGWIFVLRKLLGYPVEQVAALLSSTGGVHPGAWCHLCGPCSALVLDALDLQRQVAILDAKVELIGRRLKTELRKSLVRSSGNLTGGKGEGHHGHDGDCGKEEEVAVARVQEIIRQFYAVPNRDAAVIKTSSSQESWWKTAEQQSQSPDLQEPCPSSSNDASMSGEAAANGALSEDSSKDDDGNEDTGDDDDPLFTPSHEESDDGHDDDNNSPFPSSVPFLRRSTRCRTQASTLPGISSKSARGSDSSKAKKCEVCDVVCDSLPEFKKHMKTHSSSSSNTQMLEEFICPICQHSMASRRGRINHMRTHHPKTPLACDKCDFSTDTAATYYKHEDAHKIRDALQPDPNDSDSLRCKLCDDDTVAGNWKEMFRHVKRNHLPQIGVESFSCSMCDLVVFRKDKLKRHCARIHPDNLSAHVTAKHSSPSDKPGFSCKVCGLKMSHRRALLSHMSTEHQELYQFKCDSCVGVSFQTRMSLVRHKEEKHDHDPKDKGKGNGHKKKKRRRAWNQYDCNKCTYKTTVKVLLGRHMQDHLITENFEDHHDEDDNGAETKARCKLCGTVMCTLSMRYQHLNKKHQSVVGIQLYQCHLCGKGFNNATSLGKHANMHKRNAAKDAADAEEATPKAREKVVCEQCGESFRDGRQLSTHRYRFHSGNVERMAKSSRTCKLCGVKFLHCRRLATHMREKHGELYRHKCDLCDAAYENSNKLNLHKEATHFNRTWVCQYCNKTYKISLHKGAHLKYCRAYPHSKNYNKDDKDGQVVAGESATEPANE